MRKLFVVFVLFSVSVGTVLAKYPDSKPRVIVMADGEIDDHSSIIRFLLYPCDVDVLAIIETNSNFQLQGLSDKDWYEKHLEAYEQVYPNLVKHNTNYPTTEKLRKISFMGDENEDHLRELREKRWDLIPGGKITFKPENWPDKPGTDKIVEIWYQDGGVGKRTAGYQGRSATGKNVCALGQ